MKPVIKIFTLILLLFNSAGALYGGYHLIRYPDGSSIGLSLKLLQHSGFNNYVIPGIILFAVNGLYGIFVCGTVLFNAGNNSLLVIIQGLLLTGWIIIQLLLIKTYSPFQIILGGTGILLIVLGLFKMKYINRSI